MIPISRSIPLLTMAVDIGHFTKTALADQSAALPTINEHGNAAFPNKCAECPFVISEKGGLDQHATESGHLPFLCTCGKKYAKSFCLTRHINSSIGPGFPCGLCDNKSFPRLDKLQDHLRRYHKLGHQAFNQYRHGGTSSSSASLPISQGLLFPAENTGNSYSQQICSVAPGFGPMSAFDGFPPVPNTAPEASVEFIASPGSSTVSTDSPELVSRAGKTDFA